VRPSVRDAQAICCGVGFVESNQSLPYVVAASPSPRRSGYWDRRTASGQSPNSPAATCCRDRARQTMRLAEARGRVYLARRKAGRGRTTIANSAPHRAASAPSARTPASAPRLSAR
jgi:hypothetical protein